MDRQYTIEALKDVYHARWGIEELYKISKEMIVVDDFHGKSERTVKQCWRLCKSALKWRRNSVGQRCNLMAEIV